MAQNDFLEYAYLGGANVVTQAAYLAATWRGIGFTPGIADASEANKVWRQTAFVAAAIATFIVDELGVDVLDNGDLAGFVANLTAAIGIAPRPARTVASSAALNISLSDYAIGLNRTIAPAAMNANLPSGAAMGQEFQLDDLSGNWDTANVTLVAPGGTAIVQGSGVGNVNFSLVERWGSASIKFYSDVGLWKVRLS